MSRLPCPSDGLLKLVAVLVGWLVWPITVPVCDGVGVGVGTLRVGVGEGAEVGVAVGPCVGVAVGFCVGFVVGLAVGCEVAGVAVVLPATWP